MLAQVIVDIVHENVAHTFTYTVPPGMELSLGQRVEVPFGPRNKEGIIVAFSEVSDLPPERLRPIRRPLESYPAVLPQLLTLAQWLAETNHCPLAETLRLMLPAEMRGGRVQVKTQLTARYTAGADALPQALERQGRSDKRRMLLTLLKDGQPHPVAELRMLVRDPLEALHNLEAQGLVALSQEEVLRRPGGDEEETPAPDPPLMPAQQEALDVILPHLERGDGRFLLHGVTGSGKTEVFIRLVRHTLRRGRSAIILVPEIALTPQMVRWFRGRFGPVAAVLHSRLSAGERFDEWRRIRRGDARVVIGARSAIFAPVEKLGLVVVDEEHEQTYLSDRHPRYDAREVAAYTQEHPDNKIIKMGIGDVTMPLAPAVIEAMHQATEEQAHKETFHGYSPDSDGYPFLREAIASYYKNFGVDMDPSEVFVGDGAKSDVGNIVDLFDVDNTVLVPDPVYPVYVDTNIISGRNIAYMDANEQNGFLPLPDPSVQADIIYLCSPNNPTGATYNKEQLQVRVDYARKNDAVILYDAAYECFISDGDLARSIFEIEGARECAIEICSFSKIAGFTGTRCGYTVVPHELEREGMNINKLWLRRQTTKFNGVPYVVQRAAAAVFTESGMAEIQSNLDYYRRNAKVIADALDECGVWYCGGKNSPYIWLRCPGNMKSWEFFDWLLENCGVVGTPGVGFGECGEGYFRLTAFGDAEKTKEAAQRIKTAIKAL